MSNKDTRRAVMALSAVLTALIQVTPASASAATLDVLGVLRSQGGGPVADGKFVTFFRLHGPVGVFGFGTNSALALRSKM